MTTPLNTLTSQIKDKHSRKEKETIFLFLQNHLATASMISKAMGIPQKNICRYKRDLEQAGELWEVSKQLCKVTGYKAWYLTTNIKLVHEPELRNYDSQ